MLPTSRQTARLLAALLASLALLAAGAPRAYADPSTNERRKVAEEVAASVCQTVPRIPKLPTSVDPNRLCRSVIVENVDPEGNNSGVLAACQVALPVLARAAAKYCASAVDKLLDPARELFLDKVVPVASSSPASLPPQPRSTAWQNRSTSG